MLDVCLLGTAGMMPLPHRWLTAALMRYNGSNLCGSGIMPAVPKRHTADPYAQQQAEMRNGQNHSQ